MIELCIGYHRTFQTKELSFIGSGSLLFPHEYTGEGRDAEGVEDLPVYECEKRSFPYSIMPSSFVWNVRYLTCTIIELVNKMKYACYWFFSFPSFFLFFFALYRKLIYILKEHLTCIKGEIINRKFYSNLVYVHFNFIAIIELVTKSTLKDAFFVLQSYIVNKWN